MNEYSRPPLSRRTLNGNEILSEIVVVRESRGGVKFNLTDLSVLEGLLYIVSLKSISIPYCLQYHVVFDERTNESMNMVES